MVHHEHHGRVTLAVIDRPERRNAVDHATLIALAEIIESCVGDGSRALVITGSGGAFSAGADLSGVEGDEFHIALRRVLTGLSATPIVTIAAVDGVALGAGTQLAVACDLRTATADSRFGIPAARLGLMVDQWTADRLSAMVGPSMARAMLLAAETIDGATAARLGFVHRIGALADALTWAEAIAQLAPLTIAGHKLMAEQNVNPAPPGDEADRRGAAAQAAYVRAWSSDDLAEGRQAFAEKRPARFVGR